MTTLRTNQPTWSAWRSKLVTDAAFDSGWRRYSANDPERPT